MHQRPRVPLSLPPQGQATDIHIHAEEILKVKRRLNEIYVRHTGKTYDEIGTGAVVSGRSALYTRRGDPSVTRRPARPPAASHVFLRAPD